ncbi:metal-sensing transcriptional repressor [Pectinatus haikarae]|uniref:DNA-binding FrmR family transcriptional regulator n=1 Tax=Pectinatus haikarae TaxID=349096 RepID=A0ABT9YAV7_9FIRM|nr:metal-sensing transcriptional repressor [Pectinatus haikarae]MDQ0204947.1 DNA-binding FrmR family transcriptional regulator [Pectinatus haikarae]
MALKKVKNEENGIEIDLREDDYAELHADENAVHHAHAHTHKHTQTHAVLNRMARIIGHMTAVRRMVESERDCSDVLIQLAAINAAVTNVSKLILKDHMEHCIVDAAKTNDNETIEKLKTAIDKFIK